MQVDVQVEVPVQVEQEQRREIIVETDKSETMIRMEKGTHAGTIMIIIAGHVDLISAIPVHPASTPMEMLTTRRKQRQPIQWVDPKETCTYVPSDGVGGKKSN
jgi:hypothetical protein